jgi:hypothetical protein
VQAVVQHFKDVLALLLLDLRAVRVFGQETIEAGVVDKNLRADKVEQDK